MFCDEKPPERDECEPEMYSTKKQKGARKSYPFCLLHKIAGF